ESFTVLHAPAEGFPAPLTLALVATPEGGRILAASPAEERLHIGARASATHVEGKWLLTLLPPRKLSFRWMAARASRARRFLRRGPAPMAKH
ncbi:MAG: OB-fold domain-containing protein, partial [Dehalococcoidia bacterium]